MTTAGGKDCVLGIDVSRWQPSINWTTVAECRKFAWVKACGGDGGIYTDPMYGSHAANSAGKLARGAYMFMGVGNGAQVADRFMAVTNGYVGFELPPLIDFEPFGDHGQFKPSAADLSTCLAELRLSLARRWPGPTGEPIVATIYTGSSMRGNLPGGVEIYDLALAAYQNPKYDKPWEGVTNTATPNIVPLGSPDRWIPAPWRAWNTWQYAGGDGGCPGVGDGHSNCDQDAMTVEMFNRLTGGSGDDMPLNEADKDWIRSELEAFTGIPRDQANGPVSDTNRANLAAYHQDDRTVIIDGILKSAALRQVGWSGREYFYRDASKPDVYEILRVATGASNPDGSVNHEYARMHVKSPTGGDGSVFLTGVAQMGRNPAVVVYDRNDPDPEKAKSDGAILDQFDALRILNP